MNSRKKRFLLRHLRDIRSPLDLMFPVPCLSLRRFVHNRSRRCLTVRQIVRTPQISLVPPIQLFLPLLSVPRIDHILLTVIARPGKKTVGSFTVGGSLFITEVPKII